MTTNTNLPAVIGLSNELTEDVCKEWIARHTQMLFTESERRHDSSLRERRIRVWCDRLKYVEEHGPTVCAIVDRELALLEIDRET